MFEFGALSEILIIAVVALILIGPKELPRVLYQCGRWLQKIRHWSHHIRQELDQYVDEGMFDEYVETQNKKQLKTEKKHTSKKTHTSKNSKKNHHE